MIIGEWSEGATVTFLFAFAQILEARSMDRARNAIRALMDLTPPEAVVRRDGRETRARVDDVRLGEILLVKPGEKIPLDGVVVCGHEPRQPGAHHRRVASCREDARVTTYLRERSTGTARSISA